MAPDALCGLAIRLAHDRCGRAGHTARQIRSTIIACSHE
jgi:hypothetical protein